MKLKNLIKEEKYFVNPVCPKCKHYNAMLLSHEKQSGKYGEEARKCRDCGFEANYSHKDKIDIGNNTQTYKRLDGEDGQIKEESDFQKNYLPNEVKNFVSKSNTNSPYKPQIKLHWADDNNEVNTKWLAVSWEMIGDLIDVLRKNR